MIRRPAAAAKPPPVPPVKLYPATEPTPGTVLAIRVLLALQDVPLIALMVLTGWTGAAFLAPFIAVGALLLWLTFVRRRWSFAVLVGTEVIVLLVTLLSALIGLIGVTMSQGGTGLWEVLSIAVLCVLAAIVTMVLLWSAQVHDAFNL